MKKEQEKDSTRSSPGVTCIVKLAKMILLFYIAGVFHFVQECGQHQYKINQSSISQYASQMLLQISRETCNLP